MTKNFSMFKKRADRKINIILFHFVRNLSGRIRLRVFIIMYIRRCVVHGLIETISLRVDELSYCL